MNHLTEVRGLSWFEGGAGRVELVECATEGGHEFVDHVFGAEDVIGVGAHLSAAEGFDG
jgi:hypothetical protein